MAARSPYHQENSKIKKVKKAKRDKYRKQAIRVVSQLLSGTEQIAGWAFDSAKNIAYSFRSNGHGKKLQKEFHFKPEETQEILAAANEIIENKKKTEIKTIE